MKAWIKAGLVGAVLEILFTLPTVLIFVAPEMIGNIATCCTGVVFLLVLPLVGILTTIWLQKPATTKSILVQSALAGLLASIIDGVFTVALMAAMSISGLTIGYIERSIPDAFSRAKTNTLFQFYLSLPGQVISTSVCAIVNILIATGLSMLGAVIYAAIVRKKTGVAK
jgi:hypothetical protein